MFQSVGFLAEKFRHHRLASPRRNVMIVVFTDEAGDDIDALDATVDVCRKYEMPVYVIGVPAPFGRETAYVKYVDPDPNFDQSPQKAPVHQGPESLLPERIMLLFGGTAEDEEQMDSGFGPFGLCRLAYETGGLYFTVHPNRETGKKVAAVGNGGDVVVHLGVLRRARDAELPARLRAGSSSTTTLLKSNKACAALVEASRLSATTPMENVRLRFPRVDDGQFARDLSNAQREAAKLEPKIEALVAILRQGERDRDKITTPRWQAGFDLAIGRALAVKVRTEGYNAMLAVAKQGLKFKDEKNDTWELRPSDSDHGQQRAGEGRRGCEEVSEARRGRPQGNALGGRRREGAEAAARLGMARDVSPTSPAAWPRPKRTAIARGPSGPSRRESRAAIRRRCSSWELGACRVFVDSRESLPLRALPIRHRIHRERFVRIVPVEVHGDPVGDDFDELAFELLHRLVLGRDAAVDRVQHFAQMRCPHQLAVILHVVDGDRHVGAALVQRLALVQLEVVELDVHDLVGVNGFGQFAEIAPIAFVDPVVDFARIHDVDVLDVLDQQLADALAAMLREAPAWRYSCDDGGLHMTTTRSPLSPSHSAGTMLPPSKT